MPQNLLPALHIRTTPSSVHLIEPLGHKSPPEIQEESKKQGGPPTCQQGASRGQGRSNRNLPNQTEADDRSQDFHAPREQAPPH